MLKIQDNKRWHEIGARVLIPVHDELLAEAPIEHYEEAAELLSKCMCDAADFLPFPSKCDVEVTYRWYGMEYPCPYPKPKSLDNMSEDNIKWVQYHLVECEYDLPILPNEDGSKPIGDAAHGVNGVITDEMLSFIKSYERDYGVTDETFLDHIERRVDQDII